MKLPKHSPSPPALGVRARASHVPRWLAALTATALACEAGTPEPAPDLRLNHVQVVGTHNSYHLQPKTGGPKDWRYSHQPLDVQAGELGVRQFELDVYWDADAKHFRVLHVPVLDPETTCSTLTACLQALRSFSDKHPGHVPLWVWIEPKDGHEAVEKLGLVQQIAAAVDAVWPAARRVSPDDVRQGEVDLVAGVARHGWPALSSVRGKAMFNLLDSDAPRDGYVAAHPTLAGQVLFAEGEPGDRWAVTSKVDDPTDATRMAAALAAGQLVRTRADSTTEPWAGDVSRRDLALASGAHACSTDFPAPVAEPAGYSVQLPQGVAARCNPVTAPDDCRDALLDR